ncbi:MAG: hypothetical protein NC098_09425 [Lachnoclostridium sp.]|nr:hypothetical protein [Lachnoclostridium sp.]
MSVYVDKIAHPYYDALKNKNMHNLADRRECVLAAETKLALCGINIGVDVLVDIMTGGATVELTPLETAALQCELINIWLDYEVCNGRWH